MRKTIKTIRITIFTVGLLAAVAVSASWEVQGDASSLRYLSSKLVPGSLQAIFESNLFAKFHGQVQDNKLVLMIDTKSVNTKIPIRDMRVVEHVFQSAKYPFATVTLPVNEKSIDKMAIGVVEMRDVQPLLTLRGITHPISAKVSIVRTQADRILVQSVEPVLVDASRYAMTEDFSKLQEIAKLFKIPMVIPVSFSLQFMRN